METDVGLVLVYSHAVLIIILNFPHAVGAVVVRSLILRLLEPGNLSFEFVAESGRIRC